jgi:hypothetical protein
MKRSIVNGQGAALLFGGSFDICDLYQDLSATQRRICRDQVLVMGSVVEGARLARKECSNQFRNERWDCSSISEGPTTVLGLMSSYGKRLPWFGCLIFWLTFTASLMAATLNHYINGSKAFHKGQSHNINDRF